MNVLFFFTLVYSKDSITHRNHGKKFLKGFKKILFKTHVKLTNQMKKPMLWCLRHILPGNLLKHCWHLGNEEIYYLSWENLDSLSWVNCSLFPIPLVFCSTMIIIANILFLHWNSLFACSTHPPLPTATSSRTWRVTYWFMWPHDSAWNISGFQVSWMRNALTVNSFECLIKHLW